MTQILKDSIETTTEHVFDRRKAKRLYLNFSIEVSGVDGAGQPFVECTKTEDVSEAGCRLLTTIPFKCGDRFDIKLIPPSGERLPEEKAQQFEIMWVTPMRAGWSVGARKIHGEKMWKVLFPPFKRSSEASSK